MIFHVLLSIFFLFFSLFLLLSVNKDNKYFRLCISELLKGHCLFIASSTVQTTPFQMWGLQRHTDGKAGKKEGSKKTDRRWVWDIFRTHFARCLSDRRWSKTTQLVYPPAYWAKSHYFKCPHWKKKKRNPFGFGKYLQNSLQGIFTVDKTLLGLSSFQSEPLGFKFWRTFRSLLCIVWLLHTYSTSVTKGVAFERHASGCKKNCCLSMAYIPSLCNKSCVPVAMTCNLD